MTPDESLIAWEFFASALGFGFAVGAWFYLLTYFLTGGGRFLRDWFGSS